MSKDPRGHLMCLVPDALQLLLPKLRVLQELRPNLNPNRIEKRVLFANIAMNHVTRLWFAGCVCARYGLFSSAEWTWIEAHCLPSSTVVKAASFIRGVKAVNSATV